MNKKHLGSSFDDFLDKEGTRTETEAIAVKRILAFQLSQMMKEQSISKTAMARELHTSRTSLERLLDPESKHVPLRMLERAAQLLGKRLRIDLI
jgi:DNA-binding Xre family transcriptional regulator